ncbi:MAG: hypothetical protein SFU85_03365 [Candidatus Methylacidiphilales bacterium]|nr:hypothetical protein [Candidatus Methylacidiphilales bacterium]
MLFQLQGQVAGEVLPEIRPVPPFVKRAVDPSAWTIKCRMKQRSPQSAAQTDEKNDPNGKKSQLVPVSIRVVKSNKMLNETTIWNDESKSQTWVINGVMLYQKPGSDAIYMGETFKDAELPNYAASDFKGISWIDAAHFVKVQKSGKEDCFLYEWTERAPDPTMMPEGTKYSDLEAIALKFRQKPKVPTKVWISVKTGFPIAEESELGAMEYVYDEDPPAPLQLSGEFLKLWKKYENLGKAPDYRMQIPR